MLDYVLTFEIYSILYIVTCSIFVLADYVRSTRSKKVLIAIAVLVLSAFASCRGIGVGTDTLNTIDQYFDTADQYKTFGALFFSGMSESTTIFVLIGKILKCFGLGYRSFLFVMELFAIIPIAMIAYLRRKENRIALTMAIYLILFYQLSFNWIRQSIAVAFLLLSVILFTKGRKIGTVIAALLSVLFHASAVIGIVMYVLAWFASRSKSKRKRAALIALSVLVTVFVMFSWKNIALFLIGKGILPSSYIGYVNVFSGASGASLGWFKIGLRTYAEFALRIMLFFVPLFFYKAPKYKNILPQVDKENDFFFFRMCACLSLLIYAAAFIGLHTTYANRMTYYLDVCNILYMGLVCKNKTSNRNIHISLAEICVLLLCICYNVWLYYVLGWHDTVPFVFSIAVR